MPASHPGETPLNLASLRACGPSKVDKNRFVDTYVRSQKAYLSAYVAEGRCASTVIEAPQTESRRQIAGASSNSPPLKPRAPKWNPSPEENRPPVQRSSDVPRQSVTRAETSRVGREARKEEQATNSSSKIRTETKTSRKPDPNKHTKQKTLEQFISTKQSSNKTSVNKRPRSPDGGSEDDEHIARLAERRERRRVKRAIVQPEVVSHSATDDDEPASACKADRKNKRQKKKKKKSINLAAGMALMHGFSATNIGKNRLTHPLEKTTGVFKKGKASAKVAVKKGNTKRKLPAEAFSESKFLSKTTPNAENIASASDDDSDTSMISKTSSVHPIPKAKNGGRRRSKVSTKALVCEHASDACGSEDANPVSKMNDRLLPTRQSKHRGSVVWDIEFEDGHLACSSERSTRTQNRQETSVLLDTRKARWSGADISARPTSCNSSLATGDIVRDIASIQRDGAKDADDVDKASSSSIAPSESASQVVRVPPAQLARKLTSGNVSRFFGPPDPPRSPPPVQVEDHEEVYEVETVSHMLASATKVVPDALEIPQVPSVRRSPSSLLQHAKLSAISYVHNDHLSSTRAHTPRSPMSLNALDRKLQALDSDDALFMIDHRRHPPDDDYGLNMHPDSAEGGADACVNALSGNAVYEPVHNSDSLMDGPRSGLCGYADEDPHLFDTDLDVLEILDTREFVLVHEPGVQETETWLWQKCHADDDVMDGPLDDIDAYRIRDMSDADVGYTGEVADYESIDEDAEGVDYASHQFSGGFETDGDDFGTNLRSGSPWNSTGLADSHPSVAPELFTQGRALLLGLSQEPRTERLSLEEHGVLFAAEEDVAKSLRGHWLPHRL